MIAEKMKRAILVFGFILLIISACQYLPIILPTPTITDPAATNTPDAEATGTTVISPMPTLTVTETPVPTATQTPFPLILQTGSPAYIQNFAYIEAGCNWLGIAGQVFDAEGKTINNLVVNVKGNFGQVMIDEIGLTGVPEADIYGPGGYEIKIADKTLDSENVLEVQVLDIHGNSLSNALQFKTYSDCEKNLIIVNFITK